MKGEERRLMRVVAPMMMGTMLVATLSATWLVLPLWISCLFWVYLGPDEVDL